MEKIFIIEQAMVFKGEETKARNWEVLYAEKTMEKAQEEWMKLRKEENQRRNNQNETFYKNYYRTKEINLY